ncbi:MAG TPA: putative toxin-antitoxin system toxin component, PIN family [Anaerolineaceae bacterium]|nr:putative toxin-antitoxin system toxin component, PIN family [Anaerolineaceae bacterium]
MIVVLDTSVIISALLSAEGPPAQIIDLWEAGVFDVAISTPLLDELKRALDYPQVKKFQKMTPDEINTLLGRWSTLSVYVEPEVALEVVEDDPDDNRVLECAVAAKANYIISGDKHLLDLGEYRGIEVLPPAGFIVLLSL